MNTQILEEAGFSKGEIKVYFSLLELGESTVGPITKKSQVTASKIYPIIDKLSKKGLCAYIIKSGTKYFQAANPKKILEYLDEKNKKIQHEKQEIKKLIPKIEEKIKLSEDLQGAKVYQTFQGMRTLYNEILDILKQNKADFIAFTLGEQEYQYKESEYFFQEYDAKRRNLGIKIKLLGHESQKKFLKSITENDKNINIKYLDYKMPTGVIIYGNNVATITWGKIPTAFVIHSKQTAESYKQFFTDMWKIAK